MADREGTGTAAEPPRGTARDAGRPLLRRAGPPVALQRSRVSPPDERERLVRALMDARRAVGGGEAAPRTAAAEAEARAAVDRAKRGLGERGPVWWADGAPGPEPAHGACGTPYAGWFTTLASDARSDGMAPRTNPAWPPLPPRGLECGTGRVSVPR